MHKNVTTIVIVALIAFIFRQENLQAQVLINEICPSNVSTISNASGDFDDWVELYNPGSSSINLAGYSITDDITEPSKFVFPSISIGVGQRLVIFASEDIHYPVDHYEMAVNGNTTFRYSQGKPTLDTNWRNITYNDQSWQSGNGGVGFNDGDDGTEVATCKSVMIRKSFTVTDVAPILNAVFMMDYDDGFVAYLNGIEIARGNMPVQDGGRPSWNTLALAAHEAQMYLGNKPDSFYFDEGCIKDKLVDGLNVLSVEVHDYSTSPTDMSCKPYLFFGMKDMSTQFSALPSWFKHGEDFFQTGYKLRSAGETVYLVNPNGAVIDQQTYWQLSKDHTYGRIPDGSPNWCYINTPSPEFPNNSSVCFAGYSTTPTFSIDGGFYIGAQTISLNAPAGGTIRYTLNGDEPTATSTVFTTPISIQASKTIRARVFENGYLPGDVITKSYLINEDAHLPVITITTDSANLWDYYTGIFALGPNADSTFPNFGANFWQPWNKPASIEYFDKSHQRILSFNADIQIYGNYSRYKDQKSLEIKLHDYYGQGEIKLPLIGDKPFRKDYDRFILRNSGTDNNNVHFRDPLMQRIMRRTHVDYIAAEPVRVYLNGEMWGVYHLSEKHNEKWIEGNYGYKKDEIDFLEEVGSAIVTQVGTDESFISLYDYAISSDATTNEFLTEVGSRLDIENFVDYFIGETFYNNGDWIGEWTNNIKIWRPSKEYGKWRYLMIDLDYGFGLKGDLHDNAIGLARRPIEFSHTSDIFVALLRNQQFKTYFINRYADLLNTIYLTSNVDDVMKSFRDSMAFDMVDHFKKWTGDVGQWNSRINHMMTWASQRPQIQRDYIKSEFNLAGQVVLTMNVSPAGAGRVEISTVVPDSLPWSGIYFNGNPVTITAIPNPGYTFDHWSSNSTISYDNNKKTTRNFTTDDQITAYFTGSPQQPLLSVSEINYHSSDEYKVDDWVELLNYGSFDLDVSGWTFGRGDEHTNFTFPVGTVIPANGYLVLPEDTIKFKALFPHVSNRLGQLNFNLGNSNDNLYINDYSGNNYLQFQYADDSPWPWLPDGLGYTLELVDPWGDMNNGSNWFSGCYGGSPGKAYSQNLATLIDVIGSNIFCTGLSASLTTIAVPDYQYQWRFDGVDMSGMTSSAITVNQTGTYQLAVDNFGCTAVSPDFVLTEKAPSPEPSVLGGSRCNVGAVELLASSDDVISWYDSKGGKKIGQGEKFLTLSLNENKIYYTRAGDVCPSNYVPVLAEVNVGQCDEIRVFPNPTTGAALVFHHDLLLPGEADLIISDMHGAIFYENKVVIEPSGDSSPLYISLTNGIYIVSVYQDEGVYNTKMVVVN